MAIVTIGAETATDIGFAIIMARQGAHHRRYSAPGVDVCGSMARVTLDTVAIGRGREHAIAYVMLAVMGADDVEYMVPFVDGMTVHSCTIHGSGRD